MGVACTDTAERATPKPRGYPRVVFPAFQYEECNLAYCPFSFEQSSASHIEQKTSFFGESPVHDCWFDLNYPSFGGAIHFSYYPIQNRDDFDHLVQDAFRLSYEHSIRANEINETSIDQLENNVFGFRFDLGGPSASPVQFFLTDTTDHFVRGALYFDSRMDRDSLQPIIDYVSTDIDHLIASFRWRK